MTLFCGWGLFTTKLMAMHWREVCREITDSAPRANLWATHAREIHLTFAATVGVDTAFVAVFASADSQGGWRDQGDFSAAIDVGTTIYGAVQTVFALQFLYAAYIMRSDVLLALRRKLRAISTARPTARVLFRAQRDARARARGSRRALPRVGEAQARSLAPSRAEHGAQVRDHITQMGAWLALSGVFMIMFIVGCAVGFLELGGEELVIAWVLAVCVSRRRARRGRARRPRARHALREFPSARRLSLVIRARARLSSSRARRALSFSRRFSSRDARGARAGTRGSARRSRRS